MSELKSNKSSRTRDHIATVAAALFERDGYQGVTMEQIAAAAGVARGTLYNHFPLKDAVLAHWMHARLARELAPLMQEALSRDRFVSRVATLLDASAQWWEQHRQYAAPYIRYRFDEVREGQAGQDASDMIDAYAALISQAQQTGELRSDMSAERLARYLHYLYLCAVMEWLEDGQSALADGFAQMLEFFLQGAEAR